MVGRHPHPGALKPHLLRHHACHEGKIVFHCHLVGNCGPFGHWICFLSVDGLIGARHCAIKLILGDRLGGHALETYRRESKVGCDTERLSGALECSAMDVHRGETLTLGVTHLVPTAACAPVIALYRHMNDTVPRLLCRTPCSFPGTHRKYCTVCITVRFVNVVLDSVDGSSGVPGLAEPAATVR